MAIGRPRREAGRLVTKLNKTFVFVLLVVCGVIGGAPVAAIAQTFEPEASNAEPQFLRPETACPEDLELLFQALLRDLPSYANRVARRSLGIPDEPVGFGTVLIAGRPEFEPLEISPLTFGNDPVVAEAVIQQVFFTTLERQYTVTDFVNIEQYHWLFLTQADDGWRLVLLFTRTAPDGSTIRPPTPPRENSEGIIGQAVQLWLRDCRAGAIYPLEAVDEADTAR